ncbi:unnamed protein product, partial [marine sediment metagenome]
SPDTPILKVIRVLDDTALQIVLVADGEGRLRGTVTDGDVRRAVLDRVPLEGPVEPIMFTAPTTASVHDDREAVLNTMRRKELRQVPVVDDQGRIVDLLVLMDLIRPQPRDNPVVVMAGGLGTRLRPLTDDRPKPLLDVGGRPILETILQNFISFGFSRFYLSVNYNANQIEEHFGDGSDRGVRIDYLREDERLGTAGSLSLMPRGDERQADGPVLVINGDVLTKVNFQHLLDFHEDHGAAATMCVRPYRFQVPYGVVDVDDDLVRAISEKPV